MFIDKLLFLLQFCVCIDTSFCHWPHSRTPATGAGGTWGHSARTGLMLSLSSPSARVARVSVGHCVCLGRHVLLLLFCVYYCLVFFGLCPVVECSAACLILRVFFCILCWTMYQSLFLFCSLCQSSVYVTKWFISSVNSLSCCMYGSFWVDINRKCIVWATPAFWHLNLCFYLFTSLYSFMHRRRLFALVWVLLL